MSEERPVLRMSHDCWRVWTRGENYRLSDPHSLAELAKTHRIVVRVPVPRQKWPPPLVG